MTITIAKPPSVGQTCATTAREVIDFYRRATPRVLTTLIRTEFVGPTDHHGSRFRAMDLSTGDQTDVASDYQLTTVENHCAAAIALITEWRVASYQLVHYSASDDGCGYVFTFAASDS